MDTYWTRSGSAGQSMEEIKADIFMYNNLGEFFRRVSKSQEGYSLTKLVALVYMCGWKGTGEKRRLT